MATRSIRQVNERGTSSRKWRQQLLPRIPDDITLHEISPKLPWKVFYILSAVSRAWGHAIRSRKVYDARVLSSSTEAFVIVNVFHDGIALWSIRENYLMKLPQIGHRSEHVFSFDGRIYLLGREEGDTGDQDFFSIFSNDVFVLDLTAGEGMWRKCRSMSEKRTQFDGSVIDGKIYVCGGEKVKRGRIKFCGSEVYNPKKDRWSPIKPMPKRYFHGIEAVGSELFVHRRRRKPGTDRSDYLNVYHPGKDEWRVVSPFGSGRDHLGRGHLLFVARGKLHSLDNSGIDFYNAEENSWTELHSFKFIDPDCPLWMGDGRPTVVHVDDELLIRYHIPNWVATGSPHFPFEEIVCLAKSNGFRGETKEIVWQKVPLANSLQTTRKLTSILL